MLLIIMDIQDMFINNKFIIVIIKKIKRLYKLEQLYYKLRVYVSNLYKKTRSLQTLILLPIKGEQISFSFFILTLDNTLTPLSFSPKLRSLGQSQPLVRKPTKTYKT